MVRPKGSKASNEETNPKERNNLKRRAFSENEMEQQPHKKKEKKKKDNEADKKEEASNNSNINKDFQRPNKGKKIKNSKGNEKQFGKKEEVKLTRKQKEEAGLPFARRKPLNPKYSTKVNVGGRDVELCRFHGYFVKKADWIRLTKLENELREKNIPEKNLQGVLRQERRRAEKALSREKKKVCIQCKKPGHNLSECPAIGDSKGGNKSELPDKPGIAGMRLLAKCFICDKQGHKSYECPDKHPSLHPRGGGCSECGDVTHFRRDCPNFQKKQQVTALTVPTRDAGDALEALEVDSSVEPVKKTKRKSEKVVKF